MPLKTGPQEATRKWAPPKGRNKTIKRKTQKPGNGRENEKFQDDRCVIQTGKAKEL